MIPTLNDALAIIQRAEDTIVSSKTDENLAYVEMLEDLVGKFKGQLSVDHELPEDFFEPVDLSKEQEIDPAPADEVLTPENPELSLDAQKLYDDIEKSLWSFRKFLYFYSPALVPVF